MSFFQLSFTALYTHITKLDILGISFKYKTQKGILNISNIDIFRGFIMENEEKMKQINLKLTENQLDQLEKLSNAMGNVSKSNLIRIAITEYLMKYQDLLK